LGKITLSTWKKRQIWHFFISKMMVIEDFATINYQNFCFGHSKEKAAFDKIIIFSKS